MRNWLRFRYVWPLAILAGLIVGQTFRIDAVPGSSAQVTFLDLALAGVMVGWGFRLVRNHQIGEFARWVWNHPVWRWSVIFLGWAALSLLLNIFEYSASQLVAALAYLLRLAAAIAVAWLAAFERPRIRSYIIHGFMTAGALLVGLGFLQYQFVPDFRFMAVNGWDPHIGRLLSTFYDPNYFGVFLVLLMTVSLGYVFAHTGRRRWLAGILFAATWLALALTFSRSAWVAGAIATVGMTVRRDWRLALGIGVVFVGSLFLPTRLGDRFQSSSSLANSGGLVDNSIKCTERQLAENLCDQSGSARFYSLQQGIAVYRSSPLYGIGYNTYGFALTKQGLDTPDRLSSHSASGSDSSILNIAITTGLIGLVLASIFFLKLVWALRRRVIAQADWVGQGVLWFTLSWIAASIFNNAILYILILVPWALLVGTIMADPEPSRSQKRGRL